MDKDCLSQREQELTAKINQLTQELRQVQVKLLVARMGLTVRKEATYVPCGRAG